MSDAYVRVHFEELLHMARSRRASDLHLVVGSVPILRIDGTLEGLPGAELTRDGMQEIMAALLSEAEYQRLQSVGDVTVTVDFPRSGVVRAHASRTHSGLCIAVRMLESTIPSLDDLALPPIVRRLSAAAHGLVIIAGATGCGKSTSLAAMVEHINTSSKRRIVTIEDPIEYRHTSQSALITQREVGRDVLDFPSAILAALRGDPDVLVVGEMREEATIRAALFAAQTGHLVLTTLHSAGAAQTIDRIVDAFSGAEHVQVQAQLAQVLVGVLCQRLVLHPKGVGRYAIAEVLVATDAARNLIRERKTHQLNNLIAMGRESGMQTFGQHQAQRLQESERMPNPAA